MFDIGLQEMLLIGVLALLVFGPSKLPELGRMFGRAMREFRRASDEFRSTVETNLKINEPEPVIAPPSDTPATTAVMETLPSDTETTPAESASAGEASDSKAVALSTEPFCAQRASKLFHRSSCDWVRRIPAGERADFGSIAAAKEAGFMACPVCEPWEPA